MTVGQEGPWHSVNSDIYHGNPACQTGGSIAPENIRRGTGDNRLCEECARLDRAAPVLWPLRWATSATQRESEERKISRDGRGRRPRGAGRPVGLTIL